MHVSHPRVFLSGLGLVAALSACGGAGGGCPEGAFQHAETKVCIKLPPDFQVDEKAAKGGESSYLRVKNTKTLKTFSIWLDAPGDLAKHAAAVEGMASNDLKLVASGATSPNEGKFFHFHHGPGNYDFAVALVPGKQHMYRCEIQNTPPEDARPMIEACKTVGGP